jgi:uncharacterized phage protein (predicted DNA packaging)
MAIDQSLLLKIKKSLRISHSVLDEDLADSVLSCLADLQVCGVQMPESEDPQETDPLILNALKLYCKKEFTDDTVKAAEYQKRYDSLKSCLMMAEGYREAVVDE